LKWWRAKLVRPWLETQRDHAGIREALDVLDVLINTGKQAPYFGPYLTAPQMVRHQWARLKLNDVSSYDVLEVIFALYSIAWLKPKSFDRAKQGRHFKMVLASKVIHLATRAGQNKIRGRVVGDRSPRLLNIGTRELFSHQITRRLNYISNRAAHAICKGHPEYETENDYVTGGDDAWRAPEALLPRPAPYFAP
jgi:hypothetical protein